MRLSVLDLVPVRTDQSTSDALAATTHLAQTADRLGYTRYWLAEHHNMAAVAATSPPVLIAHLAAHTSQVRLGSGGVMLPNHAPLAVAEQFALLEAAHPGRIDLGIGRTWLRPGHVAGVAGSGRPRRPRHRGVSGVSR
jgi:luciferase family oxidoreductase group 1